MYVQWNIDVWFNPILDLGYAAANEADYAGPVEDLCQVVSAVGCPQNCQRFHYLHLTLLNVVLLYQIRVSN